jgi:hypothetical protein
MNYMNNDFTKELFAYCGINCQTCVGFLGYKLNGEKTEPCKGCRTRFITCNFFKKHCKNLANREKTEYCFKCPDFPCDKLTEIDKYYSEKYGVDIIESFTHIKTKGMANFLKNEKEKWKCPACGGVICAQTKRCYTCKP